MILGKGYIEWALKFVWPYYYIDKHDMEVACGPELPGLKIGPNSVDVTLYNKLMYMSTMGGPVDPHDEKSCRWIQTTIPEDGWELKPGAFVLGSVNERFNTDAHISCEGRMRHFAQMYEGRSTMGRLGVASHITAGFGDYGFKGYFTLEIYNHSDRAIVLYPRMRIGQIIFEEVALHHGGSETGFYNSVYQNQKGPTPPVLGKDRF